MYTLLYSYLCCIFVLIPLCISAENVEIDVENDRLPHNIIPYHYELKFYFENDIDITRSYRGKADISVKVENRTDRIILNSYMLAMFSIKIRSGSTFYRYRNVTVDVVNEQLTIVMENQLQSGRYYNIILEYYTTINNADEGEFHAISDGIEETSAGYIISTHFQPNFARYAFPCFDEPEFKTSFRLTLTYPKKYVAISNTPSFSKSVTNNMAIEQFELSPVMSTYLMAFAITNYTMRASDGNVRFWSRPGTEKNFTIAKSHVNQLLDYMNAFTNLSASRFTRKIDFLIMPGAEFSVMENWALIVSQERKLLDNGHETSLEAKQQIVMTVAHELAHFWFGNLVTPKWWSYTWLSEGFAQYFQYFLVDLVYPGWELNKKLLTHEQFNSFLVDSQIDAHPLSLNENEIKSSHKYDEIFDGITYEKGASIVRMMAHILGNKFKQTIQKYLIDNLKKTTTPNDFWNAVDSQSPTALPKNKKMADVMGNWINKPGYPLIMVTYTNNRIKISQERFCREECNDNTTWYVPITYTKQSDSNKFVNTEPTHWLTPAGNLIIDEVLGDDEWIILNNQASGYYRVHYDTGLWARIMKGLTKNHKEIDEMNRVEILDDIINLLLKDKLDQTIICDLADYLAKERSHSVWYIVKKKLKSLLPLLGNKGRPQCLKYNVQELIDPFYRSFPLNETNFSDVNYTMKQVVANELACDMNHVDCINESRRLFQLYKSDPGHVKPDVNFQKSIYCTAMRHSLDPLTDWYFLLKQYFDTESMAEALVLQNALSCTTNVQLLMKYLQIFFPHLYNHVEYFDIENLRFYHNYYYHLKYQFN